MNIPPATLEWPRRKSALACDADGLSHREQAWHNGQCVKDGPDRQLAPQAGPLRGSAQFRFCSSRCQGMRPPEGGVELTPGKWRCGACWIDLARKRQ